MSINANRAAHFAASARTQRPAESSPPAPCSEPMHEKIFRVALEWCAKNPNWKRICDIPDHEKFYKTWGELSASEKGYWCGKYHACAEDAWREFGHAACKVRYGFIGTDGVFYPEITDVPLNVNSCMVFEVGAPNVRMSDDL